LAQNLMADSCVHPPPEWAIAAGLTLALESQGC
jgi:hypothetical protein